jgi:hypothetical protein
MPPRARGYTAVYRRRDQHPAAQSEGLERRRSAWRGLRSMVGPEDHGRLARAVLQVYQHGRSMRPEPRARLNEILHAGRCMDYAERLRAHPGHRVTHVLATEYATSLGIGLFDLRTSVLPVLKQASVLDFRVSGNEIEFVEEYVGLAAPFLEQVVEVLERSGPTDEQWTALESVQLGTFAPLGRRDHLHRIAGGSFSDQIAEQGVRLALASGVLRHVNSRPLGEPVFYNPAVWGTEAVDIAQFMHGLPPGERDALLGIVETTSSRRGLALPAAVVPEPIVNGARRVGLIQAATVRSTSGGLAQQTYLFPPLNVIEDPHNIQ